MTSFRASRDEVKRASNDDGPEPGTPGHHGPSPAVTNSRIAVVGRAAVIGDAGSVVVAAAVVGIGGDRSRGRYRNGGSRTRHAHAARFGGRRDGSRQRGGSDKHQGNLFHRKPLWVRPIDGMGIGKTVRSIRLTGTLGERER